MSGCRAWVVHIDICRYRGLHRMRTRQRGYLLLNRSTTATETLSRLLFSPYLYSGEKWRELPVPLESRDSGFQPFNQKQLTGRFESGIEGIS